VTGTPRRDDERRAVREGRQATLGVTVVEVDPQRPDALHGGRGAGPPDARSGAEEGVRAGALLEHERGELVVLRATGRTAAASRPRAARTGPR
jgi:hypothetical protein